MKKLLIILIVSGLAISASAAVPAAHRWHRARTHVIVSAGVYDPFYAPWYGYYYPPYPVYTRPTRLELKIDDIKNDYRDKIWSARHDKTESRVERKKTVHELKHEREQAINQAQRDYYKQKDDASSKQ